MAIYRVSQIFQNRSVDIHSSFLLKNLVIHEAGDKKPAKSITLVLQGEDGIPDNLWYISQAKLEQSEGGGRQGAGFTQAPGK